MKKKLFFAAVAIVAFASCSDNEFIGENINSPNSENGNNNAIMFNSGTKATTRGDIYGATAADKLGSNFYVMGTKGTEATTSPSPDVVFDNYLVHWGANTAGMTESNTANWEYVGVVPESAPTADYAKLGSYTTTQSIKYWDYSATQYDFFAFSTGSNAAKKDETNPSAGEIGVTTMQHGTTLASSGIAYTLYIPDIDALKEAYITDIKEIEKGDYGKEVQLQFKNIGSKVRVALYETVPGYAVRDVKFYRVDGTDSDLGSSTKYDEAYLISTSANSFPTKGDIKVYFPNVGSGSNDNPNKNKAAANVDNVTGTNTYKNFGTLSNFADTREGSEPEDDGSTPTPNPYHYIGRTLPKATFAGTEAAGYYETVFPVSTSYPLTLRVDYTLVSTDGSGETIKIYGAKAVVPANYTKWLPNYAYTYVFKISDNTNGWTDTDHTAQGLFPITFDAVVTEATDVTGEQTTITTVAAPTITTYQQGHLYKPADEYDHSVDKLVYAQVMDNSSTPAKPVGSNDCTLPDLTDANSLLFSVSKTAATEAEVMDALQNNIDGFGTYPIEGRNNITLTKDAHITNGVTKIEKGVNNNDIDLTKNDDGHVAAINTHALTAGTYAYVYNYVAKNVDKNVYQQIVKTAGTAIGVTDKTRYCSITTTALTAWDNGTTAAHYSTAGAPEADCIYFSVTKDGTSTKTYSFVSVEGKTTIPAGLLKVPVQADPMTLNVNGSTSAVDGTFYFEKYINNNGSYAVKVIKVQ